MAGIYRNSNACFSLFPAIRLLNRDCRCDILSCISSLCLEQRCCQAKKCRCCKQALFTLLLVIVLFFCFIFPDSSSAFVSSFFISTLPGSSFSFSFESFQFRNTHIHRTDNSYNFQIFRFCFAISAALNRFKSASYLALDASIFPWLSHNLPLLFKTFHHFSFPGGCYTALFLTIARIHRNGSASMES